FQGRGTITLSLFIAAHKQKWIGGPPQYLLGNTAHQPAVDPRATAGRHTDQCALVAGGLLDDDLFWVSLFDETVIDNNPGERARDSLEVLSARPHNRFNNRVKGTGMTSVSRPGKIHSLHHAQQLDRQVKRSSQRASVGQHVL